MLKTLVIAENPLDPETWIEIQTEDVCECLYEHFNGVWPDTAKLYYNNVSQVTDITPIDAAGVARLNEIEGTIHCVVYPAGAVAFIAIAIVAIVAVAVLMRPTIPNTALRNTQAASPNNELSARTNEARVNARIPDIYGTVRSTPDLIGVSYSTFENNQEVENSLMCIGRGYYEIHDARDGETLISLVAGSTVEFYNPFTNLVTGSPFLRIGTPISGAPKKVTKSNSVNGQILRPPNADNYIGNGDLRFRYPDQIRLETTDTEADFQEVFAVGDNLNVSGASFVSASSSAAYNVQPRTVNSFRFPMPSGGLSSLGAVGDTMALQSAVFTVRDSVTSAVIAVYDLSGTYVVSGISSEVDTGVTYALIELSNPVAINPQWDKVEAYAHPEPTPTILVRPQGQSSFNLDGEYQILAITKTQITLGNPSAVNPNWNLLQDLPSDQTDLSSAVLSTVGNKWVGPYVLDQADQSETILNFVASNGIYKDDGRRQRKYSVRVEIEITQIDSSGNAIGSPYLYQRTLAGSAYSTDSVGLTAILAPGFIGPRKIRVRRDSQTDLDFEGSVVDEVKWRDLYSSTVIKTRDLGNVTVVRSKTYATSGALTLKERKLNCLVTRKIPRWEGGKNFSTNLYATNDAAEIFSAMSLDPMIGNRSLVEMDFESIYGARDAAVAYFGSPKAFEFSYTFDSDNLSYEEMAASVADAVFCQCYRRGNVIKLLFVRSQIDSRMLFNHRNKVPGSETRSVTFGWSNDNDGVEYTWVDPADDAVVTWRMPENGSAINPKKVESIGVRNRLQAYFQVNRLWNRLRYQNTSVEFEATAEANTLIREERILVADGIRPNTLDGEIIEQDGLLLVANTNLAVEAGKSYTAFLQMTDKSVDAVPVQSVSGSSIILQRPPRLPLVTDATMYARTGFTLVAADSKRADAFIVSSKDPVDNFTTKITAVNYSDKYWQNDTDFINGIVGEDGIKI